MKKARAPRHHRILSEPIAELSHGTDLAQEPAVSGDDTMRISACIVCRNEADRLGPCLASVAWADEIVVMDLSSTDRSAAIAKEYGAHVVTRPPVPIVELVRNDVAAAARGEWILVLDPDERVSLGLAKVLPQLTRRAELDAVVIPRMNFDLGYPPSNRLQRYEPQLRMYRRANVAWPLMPNALPHVADDHLYRLPERDELVIIHDRNRTIPEALDRIVRYAPLQAQSMIDHGEVFAAGKMLIAISAAIYRHFLVGQAWKDGVPGMLRAALLVGFKFYVWAAFWQLSGGRRTEADDRLLRRLGLVLQAMRQISLIGAISYKHTKRLLGR